MAIDIENYVTAEKDQEGRWILILNPAMADIVKYTSQTYGMPEKEVVETLVAKAAALVFIEDGEGKQIFSRDPKDGSEKLIRLFHKSS